MKKEEKRKEGRKIERTKQAKISKKEERKIEIRQKNFKNHPDFKQQTSGYLVTLSILAPKYFPELELEKKI